MSPLADAHLSELYRDSLRKYDRGAMVRKWWYQFIWTTITAATWLTLLLAIFGTAFEHEPWVAPLLLNRCISVLGGLVAVLTIAQTALGLQGRWLAYRAAAERLRRTCMLYRAGLPPFDGAEANAVLEQAIRDIGDVAGKGRGRQFQGRFAWRYILDLLRPPAELRQRFPSTPDEGPAAGPLDKESDVLEGRLSHQRAWYVRKSRRYFCLYLLFQGAILSCAVANFAHVVLFHRIFWVVGICTSISLGLIACRDFLDYGPLFLRYLQTAGNLKEIEDAYRAGKPPFDQGSDAERRQRLVDQVEQTLASEFQLWHVTRR